MFFDKRLNLIVYSILFSFSGYAQTAIVAGGGDVFAGNGSVSCSIGQLDYLTASSMDGVVAAGVQQAFVQVRQEEETTGGWVTKQVKVSVYPNPTSDRCYISIDDPNTTFHYEVWDLNGRVYLSGDVSDGSTVPFENMMYGTYLLKIIQGNEVTVTFKIIKE